MADFPCPSHPGHIVLDQSPAVRLLQILCPDCPADKSETECIPQIGTDGIGGGVLLAFGSDSAPIVRANIIRCQILPPVTRIRSSASRIKTRRQTQSQTPIASHQDHTCGKSRAHHCSHRRPVPTASLSQRKRKPGRPKPRKDGHRQQKITRQRDETAQPQNRQRRQNAPSVPKATTKQHTEKEEKKARGCRNQRQQQHPHGSKAQQKSQQRISKVDQQRRKSSARARRDAPLPAGNNPLR